MPLSQFTKAKLGDVEDVGRGVSPGIEVEGPLEGITDKYIPPFAVHVTIIQSATKDDHRPEKALRAVGFTTVNAGENKWVATIDPKGVPFDRGRAARGIGVVVLARTEGYTSEVLTWCDHLPDLNGTTMEQALEGSQAAA